VPTRGRKKIGIKDENKLRPAVLASSGGRKEKGEGEKKKRSIINPVPILN